MTELFIVMCPACNHFALDMNTRVCNHCGVAVARGSSEAEHARRGRRYPARVDQDRIGRMTDYARTKEDKQ